MPDRIGASPEVALHHALQHPCIDAHPIEEWCPCHSAFVVLCSVCYSPIFFCVDPDHWCRHAEAMYRNLCAVQGRAA